MKYRVSLTADEREHLERIVRRGKHSSRTIRMGFARDNSHGFETAHAASLANVTRLLVAYLSQLTS